MGYDLILFDEISKVDRCGLSQLTTAIRNWQGKDLSFVITGSTQWSVREVSMDIGRCYYMELPAITYTESLLWESDGNHTIDYTNNSYKSTEWINLSSNEKFIAYITKSNSLSDETKKGIFYNTVKDTITSNLKKYDSNLLDNNSYMQDLWDVVKYISLVQSMRKNYNIKTFEYDNKTRNPSFRYKSSNGKMMLGLCEYVEEGKYNSLIKLEGRNLSNDDTLGVIGHDILKDYVDSNKITYNDITFVCALLEHSGLAKVGRPRILDYILTNKMSCGIP